MSTVDVNSVIVTGENSVIRLNKIDSDAFTTNASFWRILTSPAGPGDVLYLKSEVTEDRWRIYSDNIAIARWLQSTVVGAISAELRDPAIPVGDAQFNRSGNGIANFPNPSSECVSPQRSQEWRNRWRLAVLERIPTF